MSREHLPDLESQLPIPAIMQPAVEFLKQCTSPLCLGEWPFPHPLPPFIARNRPFRGGFAVCSLSRARPSSRRS
jgi:hypothetical protein